MRALHHAASIHTSPPLPPSRHYSFGHSPLYQLAMPAACMRIPACASARISCHRVCHLRATKPAPAPAPRAPPRALFTRLTLCTLSGALTQKWEGWQHPRPLLRTGASRRSGSRRARRPPRTPRPRSPWRRCRPQAARRRCTEAASRRPAGTRCALGHMGARGRMHGRSGGEQGWGGSVRAHWARACMHAHTPLRARCGAQPQVPGARYVRCGCEAAGGMRADCLR